MKTRTKVILDEWFGRSAVVLLNILARILGKILSIDHSLDKPPIRIVVCKFLGMGSIIQATPLLQTLRKNFPDSEIIFITSSSNRKLLESIDVIDKIFDVDDSSSGSIIRSTISVLRSLWEKKTDLYIDLETYSYYSTALATMSRARNRFGFYRVERNIRMGVYTHMMYFNSKAPIAQAYLQMARLAGCNSIVDNLYPFFITESDRMGCRRKLVSLAGNISGNFVIVNPNASDLRIERRWPATSFISLLKILRESYPEKIFLLIGAENEISWVKGIHDKLDEYTKKRVFNSAGLFTLYELFALIDSCELVISNDTGPMHISFALSKPTISLFGPSSPAQYGQSPCAFGIYKNIYCSPCVHDFLTPPCKGDNQCMKQISVEDVVSLSKEIFSDLSMYGKVLVPPMNFLKTDGKSSLGIIDRTKKKTIEDSVVINCSCCKGQKGTILHRGLSSVYSNLPWKVAECNTCGNIITLPVPQPELLNEIYKKTYLYPVHKLALDEKKFRSHALARYMKKIISSSGDKTFFEAGCMYGYLLDELKNDYRVKGIEIGKEAVDYCRGRGLDVNEISIEDYLSQNNELFDVIVLSHVLEHLLSPDKVIEQLRDRLNPGGKLIICVPNSDSFCRKLFGRYWGWWQVPVHINHFRKSALQNLAAENEMTVEDVRYKGGDSLMLLLNLMNLFEYESKNFEPGIFQKTIIRLFTFCFRYWYYLGNEEVTIVLGKKSI